VERLATRLGVEWEGMPYGMPAQQVVVASWGLALLGLASGAQLWRLKPSGRVVAIAYLAFVGLYALAQAWLQREVAAIPFGAFNLWLGTVLLRKDAGRACRAG
jgi:apolipoprotein N-acyltransferase